MENQELPPEASESYDAPIQLPAADDDTHMVESIEDESLDPAHHGDSPEESLDPARPSDSPAVKDSPGNWTSWHGFAN